MSLPAVKPADIAWEDVERLVQNYFRCNCLRPKEFYASYNINTQQNGDSSRGVGDNISGTFDSQSQAVLRIHPVEEVVEVSEVAGDWSVLAKLATDDIVAQYPSGAKRGKAMWLSHVTKTYNRYLSPFLQYSVVDPGAFITQMRVSSKEFQHALFSKVAVADEPHPFQADFEEYSLTVPWTLDVKLKTASAIALCCCWLGKTIHSTGKNVFHFRKYNADGKVLISFVHTIAD